ncbi:MULTISPECIES: homoserine dehydrogenase [Pseudonocardia]|uniref:Homoserine dehydrogenase n=2 Tax=Pseudonocardia TaxID=1847 RepID=A0A1Y2N8N8_PSEAH|nr:MULTISPECIES: homoserine dehydrogenase [Pseudonocardia]OSY43437.1 Homoserine dehydrogenase [Pseudonocardia autotrophica]TDN73567.1 homoserine dehydrogenase [Pseudonocardia autotrophica]BBG04312.1 homoserine dehydrogenase [Pseudonocardia autotrophica]GEC25545.1 homoserine dehydrogenase [Pseudonocardia saturnea]
MARGENGAVRVALLGCGTVGTEVVRLITDQAADLTARVGTPVELVGVAVRRPHRHPWLTENFPHLVTTDAGALVARDDVDVVVEVIGGIEPVRGWLLEALKAGKSVVTANKALLAEDGPALAEAADASGADLYYEAAVAGAIPLLRPLRESLAGDRITRVAGIVNGTSNFILSAMASDGTSYADALEEATRLGYAEADPSADVDGYDAASKAAILATLAFHTRITASDVHREGMRGVSSADVAAARRLGCTIKLLAICERVTDERPDGTAAASVSARVYPAMVPDAHPLARVDGAFNAVFVEAEAAGQLMFYGQGAGGAPTASAVLGDLVAVARNRVGGGRGPRESAYASLPVRPIGDVPTRYHVDLEVADREGVLAAIAGEFARQGVSIAAVRQTGGVNGSVDRSDGSGLSPARLTVVTHSAREAALSATVAALADLDHVIGVVGVLRVEGLGRAVSALGMGE